MLTKPNCTRLHTAIRASLPLLLLSLAGNNAQAQSASNDERVLEEVIVTALRRAEGTAIMDTAIAVDAMSGSEIESRGFTSIMEALSTTPGLSYAENANVGPAIQIRGVSAIVGSSVVGYYLDDLPYTRIGGNVTPDLNPYDLNRVEVLRGPQGTLFGVGAQGGVVRVITQDPIINEFSGKVTGAYSWTDGADENDRIQGALNIPLIEDTLAMRLVAAQVNDGGYIDLVSTREDDYNEMDDTSYRVKLLWTPTEDISVVASYWNSEREGYQNFGDDNLEAEYYLTNIDALFLGPPLATEVQVPAGSEYLEAETKNELYGLKVEYLAESYSFLSTTSYLEGSNSARFIYTIPGLGGVSSLDEYPKLDTFAQEFKLSTRNEGDWNWTLGAIYLDIENEDAQTTYFHVENPANWPILEAIGFTQTTGGQVDTVESESWAIFGESVHALGEQWELTVGARYFEDDRDSSGPESSDFDEWTGKVNLAWRPTDDSLYYANIATGFRSGGSNSEALIEAGANSTPPVDIPVEVDPDEVTSYEVGGKWTLLDGRLNLESAVYYLEWDDIQTLIYGLVDSTLEGWGANANSAAGGGVEFAATYQADGLTLAASGNWNNVEYDDDLPSGGISDGDTVMNVPELTWQASATYAWPMGELTGLAYLGATYTDERSDYGIDLLGQPSTYTSEDFTVVNARIGVETERWSVFLTGTNITDENVEVSQLALLADLGAESVRMRPATYGIELNLNF